MNRFNALSMDQVFMFKMIEKPPVVISFNSTKTVLKNVDRQKILVILIFCGWYPIFPKINPILAKIKDLCVLGFKGNPTLDSTVNGEILKSESS